MAIVNIPLTLSLGFSPPPLRTITLNATRDGVQTGAYKEAVLWESIHTRTPLLFFPIRNGISNTQTVVASAIDGKRAIMLYDFDAQPYATVRTPNITADIVLNMDLIDVDSPPLTGVGYLSGNFPLTLLNESSNPSHANVRAIVKHEQYGFNGSIAGTTTVLPNGHWVIDNLNMDLMYDVIAEIPGYNGIIISNVSPDPDYVPPVPIGDPHWDNVVSLLHFYKGYPFDEKGHLWLFSNSDGFEYVNGMFGTALKNTNRNNRRLFSDLSGYQIVNYDIWTMDIQFSYLNADNVNINGLVMIGDPGSNDNRYIQHISVSNRAWWNSRDTTSLDIGDRGDGNMRLLSIVRDGGRQLGFVDGVKVFDSNILFPIGASPIFSLFTRRGGGNLNNSMIGVIEQFRMTQGVARYTENFTPPTEPFPNHGIL